MAEQNYETNGTMRREWTRLLEVPLNNRERQWLQERLEVLSVEEEAKLAAALLRTDPWTAQESVDCLLSLAEYQVCHPAGSYEALGRYALRYELSLPAELEEHVAGGMRTSTPGSSWAGAMWNTRRDRPRPNMTVTPCPRRTSPGASG